MNRQGRMEKKNKTLGRERCENIDKLYINKIITTIIIIIIIIIIINTELSVHRGNVFSLHVKFLYMY